MVILVKIVSLVIFRLWAVVVVTLITMVDMKLVMMVVAVAEEKTLLAHRLLPRQVTTAVLDMVLLEALAEHHLLVVVEE